MLKTTLGQLLVNEALPEDLRDYTRVLDGKSVENLFSQIISKHPERYAELAKKLMDVARDAAFTTGGMSFGLDHLKTPDSVRKMLKDLEAKTQQLLQDPKISDRVIDKRTGMTERERRVLALVQNPDPLAKAILDESIKENNPLAAQVVSKARGNPTNLRSLRGSDLLYVDHHDNLIPIPVFRSYSQGVSPAEFFSGSFGARKGLIDTKFMVADAGAFAKELNRASHRLIVTAQDSDTPPDVPRGLPVDVADKDSDYALLAHDIGPFKRNTIIDPTVRQQLRDMGIDKFLVRSPLVGGYSDGGLYSKDVGYRERGNIGTAPVGDQVGISAAQAISEKVSQSSLSSKHSSGVAGSTSGAVSGFKYINQLVQTPKQFPGGATHAQQDGRVQDIQEAPTGGWFVNINNEQHYVPFDRPVKVKKGDTVEAGDVISEGIPNPAEIVHHKGIGEGRRYFTNQYRNLLADSGVSAHRRNIELLARGLIDHVSLDNEIGDFIPGDVLSYSALEHAYQPRKGFKVLTPQAARDHYLEKPVLHYTIGTKIRPSVIKELNHFKVDNVVAHEDPPPFQPEMIPAATNLSHDQDWMVKMLGNNLERNLMKSVWRGSVSEEKSTSFVPGLARAVDFGKIGPVKDWHEGLKNEPLRS